MGQVRSMGADSPRPHQHGQGIAVVLHYLSLADAPGHDVRVSAHASNLATCWGRCQCPTRSLCGLKYSTRDIQRLSFLDRSSGLG